MTSVTGNIVRNATSTMDAAADILISTEAHLSSRPARSPDHHAESRALSRLAEEMTNCPDRVLTSLCEQVMAVCGAESAGVSLFDEKGDFHWPAVTGAWAPFQGGGMPRLASPCGVVIECDAPLLFHDVEQQFPAAAAATPRIEEILLAPFRVDGKPQGTVWAIVHSDAKRFDREDLRLLNSLARFASAAYQMSEVGKAATDARAQLSLVNHELSHRLKNMLTMVMAVASQTLKDVTEQDAVEAFQARLQALGSAHDILLDQTWAAAPIDVIAERIIGQLGETGRTDLNGPAITLGPRSALSLSLILHELGTNAVKYGAFSAPSGRVTFSWGVSEGSEPLIKADWREHGGPEVAVPSRRGFGTRLISMGLIGAGGVKLSYDPQGFSASFEAPLRLARQESR